VTGKQHSRKAVKLASDSDSQTHTVLWSPCHYTLHSRPAF